MANSTRDIIVYGASGYTGKLIAESLHKRGIAFTAAGRSEEKLKAALAVVSERVGGEEIKAAVVVADHTLDALTDLFRGAKVVANVTGPFGQIGEVVVQAALAAGCHYIDTTGEQDFMFDMKSTYGEAYAEAGLVLAPACAFMWTVGALAAELCLETPGIDSLDLTYLSTRGVPSVASTRSFMRLLALPQYYIENNERVEWELGRTFDTIVDGSSNVYHASPWGGAAEPVWYEDDERVRNCRVIMCGDNNQIDEIAAGAKQILEQSKGDPEAVEATSMMIADSMTTEEPGKEDPLLFRMTVCCHGRGTTASNTVRLTVHSGYVITGELIAEACRQLTGEWDGPSGFVSPAVAFDHNELIKMLSDGGFAHVKQY